MSVSDYPTVAVLMSTYNGEKYLEQQIESILQQEGVDVKLVIHDDGSSDSTLDIIKRYVSTRDNVIFNDQCHLGPGMAFMKLLRNSVFLNCDYYAFSDQDDIWKKCKLMSAIGKIRGEQEPTLYCSNQILYLNGQETELRFKNTPDLSLIGHITKNELSGCTMVMNCKLAKEILARPLPEERLLKYRLHDAMIFLCALLIGKVVYDEKAYINYRIHELNTVGIRKRSLYARIRRFLRQDAKCLRSLTAEYLLENYCIKEEDKETLELLAYYKKDIKKKCSLIFNNKYNSCGKENRFIFKIKALLNCI